jgi:hypothetical protein
MGANLALPSPSMFTMGVWATGVDMVAFRPGLFPGVDMAAPFHSFVSVIDVPKEQDEVCTSCFVGPGRPENRSGLQNGLGGPRTQRHSTPR